MWIVELTFTSAPERLAVRPAHRDRLTALSEKGLLRMAGPLADDSGAVLVFDVPDKTCLDQLLADDPYYTTPGVRIESTREWSPFIE